MAENNTELININNIVVTYDGEPVIKDLSLKIFSGSFIGLIGPNGAGKTTLLLSVSGQFKPVNGSIGFSDQDIYEKNFEYKKNMGFVNERPFFYPFFTVEEYLYFIAGIRKIDRNEIDGRVDEIISLFRLSDIKDKSTSALSMGMQKKLAIASAYMGNPHILFLDEALNGIDVENAFMIKQLLKSYVEQGGTVILSTHVLEVVEKTCDRYLIMKDGKIIADIIADNYRDSGVSGNYRDLEDYVIRLLKS
ncbi:ABC transporter ATP-binding protein [candidate division KSB1 bacterium]